MERLHNPRVRETLQRLLLPQPSVVAIEGGPCGGKTTLVESIVASAHLAGRPVVLLEEVASKHINALAEQGINFADIIVNDRQLFLQIERNILADIVASIADARVKHKDTNTIILADRASIAAYVTAEEYKQILQDLAFDQSPHISLIDTMMYLPSVARESEAKYDSLKATNAARYETSEVAIQVCEANFNAIKDHPELHVFWGGEFGDKITEATEIITNPEREIEAKYETLNPGVVESMLVAKMDEGDYISAAQIEQSYHVLDGKEFRLRKNTNTNGSVTYFCSFKQVISENEKQEIRQTISEEEYKLLVSTQCIGRLEKIRHSFFHTDKSTGKKRVWVADEYNYGNRLWNLEIEVSSVAELETVELPLPELTRASYSARDLALQRVS